MIISRRIIVVSIVLVVAGITTSTVFGKNAVPQLVRPFIADNIILIQNIRKLSDIIFLPKIILERDDLPFLELKIGGKNLVKLNEVLPKGDYTDIEAAGLVFNALTGDVKKRVDATLVYQGKEYPVRVGYRGTTYDHWYFPKKSWHIKFEGVSPLGLQEIDLIIPRDRGYLSEELSHFRARKLGLFVPESKFVTLSVNGGGRATYWLVEDWSEDMLARRDLTGCLFGAELLTDKTNTPLQDAPFSRVDAWKEYNDCGEVGNEKLAALLSLLDMPEDVFPAAAERLLDIPKVLRWEATMRLAGSHHGGYGYNMRVFWNSAAEKFEFIPWDFGLEASGNTAIDSPYNAFITRLFKHENYVTRRNAILAAYVEAPEILETDLAYYDKLARETRASFYKDRMKTESILEFNEKVAAGRQALAGNVATIKTALGLDSGFLAQAGGTRIDRDDKLNVSAGTKEAVWTYLKERFGGTDVVTLSGVPFALETTTDTEIFNDVYFDTPSLMMLNQSAGVRFRTRSREDKEPLIQIKASGVGGDALSRGEWKFKARNTPDAFEPNQLLRRIPMAERDTFTETTAVFGVDARTLKPVLPLSQVRDRIYFSHDGVPVLTVTLDTASSERLWAKVQFTEIEVEITETTYTDADEARRAELRALADAVTRDIQAKFPAITRDLTPKYNKAFASLAAKIPLYRFLIVVGVL